MYIILLFFFFNETATPEIYTYCHTLSLNYALPIYSTLPCTAGQSLPYRVNFVRFALSLRPRVRRIRGMSLSADLFWSFRSPYSYLAIGRYRALAASRSEEHTSELQSLMRISYAVFCLKKKK